MSISTSYTDINSVSQLKAGSDANSPENVRKVAQQFESLFVNMMIKSMRDANAVFAEGNPLNTPQTKFYQEMYDNQMAVHLSEGPGLGLSDALMRQLSPKAEAGGTAADAGAGASGAAAPAVDQSALLARRRLQIASDYSAWAERLDRAEASTSSNQSNDWQPLRGIEAMRRSASTAAAVTGEVATRIIWSLRPRWKPAGASRSFVSLTAAPATTCLVSRPMAAGRARVPTWLLLNFATASAPASGRTFAVTAPGSRALRIM